MQTLKNLNVNFSPRKPQSEKLLFFFFFLLNISMQTLKNLNVNFSPRKPQREKHFKTNKQILLNISMKTLWWGEINIQPGVASICEKLFPLSIPAPATPGISPVSAITSFRKQHHSGC